jgi:hypothetical protein
VRRTRITSALAALLTALALLAGLGLASTAAAQEEPPIYEDPEEVVEEATCGGGELEFADSTETSQLCAATEYTYTTTKRKYYAGDHSTITVTFKASWKANPYSGYEKVYVNWMQTCVSGDYRNFRSPRIYNVGFSIWRWPSGGRQYYLGGQSSDSCVTWSVYRLVYDDLQLRWSATINRRWATDLNTSWSRIAYG